MSVNEMEDNQEIKTPVIDEATQSETQEQEQQEEVLNVSFGDEETPPQDEFSGQPAPDWVKDLRKKNRELERKLKQFEQSGQTNENVKPLPKKPTLSDCDYDEDVYNQKLDDWYETKKEYDLKEYEAKNKVEQQQKDWQNRLNTYQSQVQELNANDYSFSEDNVKDELNEIQQGILVSALKNPALFVYAVGKNEAKLKQLAQIQDPILFAAEVARLETQIKSNRQQKTPPPPEKKPSGSAPISGVTDTVLNAEYEKAQKTGNWTNYINMKKQKGK